MSEELKPCPFCGRPGKIDHVNNQVGCIWLSCLVVCHTVGTGERAIKDWNTRETP